MAGGAAINVVVKSGTNDYRGTGWGYDTDARLRARNAFQTTPNNPKNILKQYGGNRGGPILTDKLFFFANAERTTQRSRRRQPPAEHRARQPAAERAGNVVFPLPAQGGAIIYDPAVEPGPAAAHAVPEQHRPRQPHRPGGPLPDRAAARPPPAPGYINNIERPARPSTTAPTTTSSSTTSARDLNVFAPLRQLAPPHRRRSTAWARPAAARSAGGQVGRAPSAARRSWAWARPTSSHPTLLLDANFGFTHQVLGAEAPDSTRTSARDADKMNIPGTNGPDRLQGGLPGFQITNWANLGNDEHGQPVPVPRQDSTASARTCRRQHQQPPSSAAGSSCSTSRSTTSSPRAARSRPCAARSSSSGQSTMLQDAPAPADARFNSWAAFLLGLPSRGGQGGSARQPQLDLHEDVRRVRPGHVADRLAT